MENWKISLIWLTVAVMVLSIMACMKKGKKEGGVEMAEKINQSTTVADSPKLGELAPDFEAPATNGKNIKLSDLRGSWVVLYFYPKAFTSG
jgi:cytochrome oxidase Cu insertion factor (SCO1/SenC/PrrC family)